ncbi:MAG: zinc ABC transporter substrate-binding protein [Limnochordaceae bacterium]|nr:zinc ABC transporter substrate-binding protein [Limnochordaceae bacterium]
MNTRSLLASRRRTMAVLLLLAAALLLFTTAMVRRGHSAPASPQLVVVTTLPPLADITRELGGDRVSVASLLPAGASPHTFEPRPSDVRRLATARLIIRIGAGLDDWVAPMLRAAAQPHQVQLDLSSHVTLLQSVDEHTGRSAPNPHYWLDPLRVRDEIAPAIAARLSDLDPAGKAYYADRLARYRETLTALDTELRQTLAPVRGLRFIAMHSAWPYLAARYDLQEVAAIEEFPGREPSAAWLADLQRLARQHNVHTIAAEQQFNPQIARLLAQAVGGVLITLDPLGGPGVEGRQTYVELMRYNARQFLEARP